MNRREYYKKLTGILKLARVKAADTQKEIAALKAMESPEAPKKYTKEYIQHESLVLERELRDIDATTRKKITELTNEYIRIAQADETLNPADLTDDLKLMNSGVNLTEKDLMDIIERNAGNKTMIKLTMRYAEEHHILLPVSYQGSFPVEQTLHSNAYIAGLVMNWYKDEKHFWDMYNQFIGEGSDIHQWSQEEAADDEEEE